MKRTIFLLLSLLVSLLLLTGCAGQGAASEDDSAANPAAQEEAQKSLQVGTTIFPPYDFVRQLAGDYAQVTQLLPLGSESHSYEPSPQDMIRIQEADLFIYVGGESDAWVEKLLSSLDTSDLELLTLMDCVEKLEEEPLPGLEGAPSGEHRHTEEDKDPVPGGLSHSDEVVYDEHPWTSPRNALFIAEKIAGVLDRLDPEHKAAYDANLAAYREELLALDQEFSQAVAKGRRDVLLFGDRFPFLYFTKAYGLRYYAAFPGCSAETEASAATLTFLIDKIRSEMLPVVFYQEFSNQKIADVLCEDTGAKKLLFHSCHNISREDFEAGVTYLDLMRQNLINLKEALS